MRDVAPDAPHDFGELRPAAEGVRIGAVTLPYKPVVFACRVLLAAVLIGAWEAGAGRLFDDFWFSRPSLILAELAKSLGTRDFLLHIAVTLFELFCGFVVAFPIAMASALLLGATSYLQRVLIPFILAAYSVPVIALAPLFIVWFGIGFLPKVIIVALTVFFLVFFNVFFGLRDVDQDLVAAVRLVGGRPHQVLRKILLPATLPWAFAAVRIGIPYAVIAAITAEMIGANVGLGYVIMNAAGLFNATTVFVAVLVLTAMAVLLDQVAAVVERRFLRYRSAWTESR